MTFPDFLAERGLLVPTPLADGRVHRVRTNDHPKKRNGAYLFDGRTGWAQNWALDARAVVYRNGAASAAGELSEEDRKIVARTRREEEQRRRLLNAEAVARGRSMISSATRAPHQYLVAKGFPNERALVLDGEMIVPMWDVSSYARRLLSVQTIDESGHKLYLKNSTTKGGCYRIGAEAEERWLCEGYATGLSIMAALRELHRAACVYVCFSAGNLIEVAQTVKGRIVADNDVGGVGEASAIATGQPFVMPPHAGMDFNDYQRKRGVAASAGLLRIALSRRQYEHASS